jgi:hypothetical protein
MNKRKIRKEQRFSKKGTWNKGKEGRKEDKRTDGTIDRKHCLKERKGNTEKEVMKKGKRRKEQREGKREQRKETKELKE